MASSDTPEQTFTPKRHDRWREDWRRINSWPTLTGGANGWEVQPYEKLALHDPSKAAFQLTYLEDRLLRRIRFLRNESRAPANTWKENGPELSELIEQIA